MRDGWPYVVACYAVVAVTIGVWFWMILAKLRRLRDRPTPVVGGTSAVAGSEERSHG